MKDLKLTPNDGWAAHVQTLSAFEKARYNPIRRLGRIPLNMFEKMLISSGVRHGRARLVRTVSFQKQFLALLKYPAITVLQKIKYLMIARPGGKI